MLVIRHLAFTYAGAESRPVLADISLDIVPGEYVLLCGAGGSGKSTLCRTFNGLIPHFHEGTMQGEVQVAGRDTRTHSVGDLFAHVGLVFQNPQAQLFNSTVERELAFGLESLGLPRDEIRRRVAESAELVGITHLLSRPPGQLSGGEQHLVIIAGMLALRPRLLVLDEPFANLDPANVRRILTALRAINRRGTAIVLTEHRLQYALAEVSRLIVLHQGRIVQDGPPRAVLQADVTAYGLNLPPVVRIAHHLGLPEMPLTVDELITAPGEAAIPTELLPQRPDVEVLPGPPVAQFEQVSFALGGRDILRDINLDVYAGECLAIVGANGAGKTSLIRHLNGLHRPTQGRVLLRGQVTRRARVSQLARQVGLAFQNANDQFFKFQVWDEIGAGARTLGRYDEAWLHELAALFRLEPLLTRPPYRLSEGEKKRVAFAAALAARPDILILDEPTAGQDGHFRRTLGDLLHQLRLRGQTILLVTHDLDFAEQHASRWLLLAAGEVLATGPPWEVMADSAALARAHLEPTQAFHLHAALSACAAQHKV
ncbi:MAG: ABC transporter ATP-binding protein [Chloroflexaceae bacterium]